MGLESLAKPMRSPCDAHAMPMRCPCDAHAMPMRTSRCSHPVRPLPPRCMLAFSAGVEGESPWNGHMQISDLRPGQKEIAPTSLALLCANLTWS
jgi:hypothetical protein